MSSHPIKYSTGNSWRAKQIWSKLQACWGLTCAALPSAGIQTLYCVRNSTCGTAAASTRKACSINEFLLALTNKNEQFEWKPNWLILDSKWYWAQPLYERHQREIWWFWCILQLAPMRSESLLEVSSVKKAGRLDLDFHRCEMPCRADASDY